MKDRDGYGGFYDPLLKRRAAAHRMVWEECFGPIPPGLHVLHLCDNPGCVNPEHLVLGTNRENQLDRSLKGRTARLLGVDNPSSKVSDDDVRSMRELHRLGMPVYKIARIYRMHRSNVSKIVSRKSYRDVE